MHQDPPTSLPSTEVSDEALRWIMRLNSGAATAADRHGFQAWRALSEEHDDAAREAEALWSDAGNLHRDPATGVVRPGRDGTTRRNILVNATALLAVGGGLWATGFLREWTADYATGLGEARAVTLPDGSRMTLNARSAIDLNFSDSLRRIALIEGQAFFEVVPDSLRPFEVEAKGVVVRAVGTAFDVDRNLAAGAVAISVTEHAVRVTASNARSPVQTVSLLEEQMVVVDADGSFGPIGTCASSVTTAWHAGMYIAENRTLADVVAALQSYHPGWIVVRGEATAQLRVSAVLNLKTPDEALDTLASGLPILIRRLSPYLTVISGR